MDAATCLTEAAYYEARNQPQAAMFAVIEATERRIKDWRWDDDACAVVYAPRQFQWTADKPERKPEESASWELAGDIVEIVREYGPSATRCADHWHDKRERPWWVDSMELEVVIGDMYFYCSDEDDWRKR